MPDAVTFLHQAFLPLPLLAMQTPIQTWWSKMEPVVMLRSHNLSFPTSFPCPPPIPNKNLQQLPLSLPNLNNPTEDAADALLKIPTCMPVARSTSCLRQGCNLKHLSTKEFQQKNCKKLIHVACFEYLCVK